MILKRFVSNVNVNLRNVLYNLNSSDDSLILDPVGRTIFIKTIKTRNKKTLQEIPAYNLLSDDHFDLFLKHSTISSIVVECFRSVSNRTD